MFVALNKSVSSITTKAFDYGIKYNRNKNIKSNLFTQFICKESAYLLGFLFADGHINKTKRGYEISIHNLKLDLIDIQSVISYTGDWNVLNRTINNKEYTMIRCYDSNLGRFLVENDYLVKSGSSANKIISKIPNCFQRYFFLGLIDGDGCWHIGRPNLKNRIYEKRFVLTSTFNQDWKYIETLFTTLGIKYYIRRNIDKKTKHKNSQISVFRKLDLIKLIDFLYPDGYDIGFERKYELSQKIKSVVTSV